MSRTRRAVLGLDVGGANLKSAHTSGAAHSLPFALWKDPGGLRDALRRLVRAMPAADELAVTMTGELCDCFESKRQGVLAILDAVEAVAEDRPVWVFTTAGRFVELRASREQPLQAAAANWLALATFAGRYAPEGPAVLIDVGSTTADLIPLADGKPVPQGRTDPERLWTGELVYTGVRRTPVCSLFEGGAAEFFATTLDVYLVLGDIAEDAADCHTADGRPATRHWAHARLARMLCEDLETSSGELRRDLAECVCRTQVERVRTALDQVVRHLPAPPKVAVLAGEGVFLARRVLDGVGWGEVCHKMDLSDLLSEEISRSACAYAVAVLAAEAGDGAERGEVGR
jgi:probable H4MPT-linked C1 transfer pathway protein